MLKLKGCPKCQGSLYLATDMYGRYINCLQCGFTKDLPDTMAQAKPVEPEKHAYGPAVRKAA